MRLDEDQIIKRHLAGESQEVLAREYGVSITPIRRILKSAGVMRSRDDAGLLRRRIADDDLIRVMHEEGKPVARIATELGISRPAIVRSIHRTGATPRDRSEAMTLRMVDVDARGQLTRAAHQSMGKGELEMAALLATHGVEVASQVVVGNRNLDLAFGSIAVEVHCRPAHPLGRAYGGAERERIEQLRCLGWHMWYVWIKDPSDLTDAAARDAIAFSESARFDPPRRGEYRVVRGDGSFVAASRPQPD